MSNVQKISIAVTAEMNVMIQEAVKSGQFASASEVVRDALRFWEKREEMRQDALAHTRALIQAGIDSEVSAYESMDDIIAEAKRRDHAGFKKSA